MYLCQYIDPDHKDGGTNDGLGCPWRDFCHRTRKEPSGQRSGLREPVRAAWGDFEGSGRSDSEEPASRRLPTAPHPAHFTKLWTGPRRAGKRRWPVFRAPGTGHPWLAEAASTAESEAPKRVEAPGKAASDKEITRVLQGQGGAVASGVGPREAR